MGNRIAKNPCFYYRLRPLKLPDLSSVIMTTMGQPSDLPKWRHNIVIDWTAIFVYEILTLFPWAIMSHAGGDTCVKTGTLANLQHHCRVIAHKKMVQNWLTWGKVIYNPYSKSIVGDYGPWRKFISYIHKASWLRRYSFRAILINDDFEMWLITDIWPKYGFLGITGLACFLRPDWFDLIILN